MNRRKFITGLMCSGTALLSVNSPANSASVSPVPSLVDLKRTLIYQGRLQGCYTYPEQIENLVYAHHVIKPGTFTETAIVVWAGSQFQSAAPQIDEYCRRRRGERSLLFDHPVLALAGWCQPETQRVLVFREQVERLSLELTGRNYAKEIYQSVGSDRGYDFETFCQQLRPTYKETFLGEEKKDLYRYMQTMYGSARQYSWSASLVEQALIGRAEFNDEEHETL